MDRNRGKRFIPPLLFIGLFCLRLWPVSPEGLSLARFSGWSEENGLGGNTVNTIVQTPDGYIWLGLENGLQRFDGQRFHLFHKENTPEIASTINHLIVDRNGVLWIATRSSGLVQCKEGRFRVFGPADGLTNREVWCLQEAADGAIWIGTRQGLFRCQDEKIQAVPLPGAMRQAHIRALCEDRIGNIWVGGVQHGLAVVRRKGDEFDAQGKGFVGLPITCLFEDNAGTLWIGTFSRGLFTLQGGERPVCSIREGLPVDNITSLYQDRNGNLWIGTYGGGIAVRPPGGGPPTIHDTDEEFHSKNILCMFEDREQTIWVGTYGGGAHTLRPPTIRTLTSRNGLAGDITFAVFQDKRRRVWVGSIGYGATVIENGRSRVLTSRDGLSANAVVAFAETADGAVWLGTIGGGVCRWKDGVIRVFGMRDGLGDSTCRALICDRAGRLWAGSDQGNLFLLQGERFTRIAQVGARINGLYPDTPDDLLVCTMGRGLGRLRRVSEGEYRFDPLPVPAREILCCLEDDGGALWLGTTGDGLLRLHGRALRSVTKADGLPDNTIYAVLPDHERHLWLSTNNGICRLNRGELQRFLASRTARLHVSRFGREDGMRSLEGNGGCQPPAWRGDDGIMWFPTMRGLAQIRPETVGINRQIPPVCIERVRYAGREYPGNGPLVFRGAGHDLDVEYTALSFIHSARIGFKYKLEGRDGDWIECGGERRAHLPTLAGGRYRLHVQACNSDGLWNTRGAVLEFRIEPYLHQAAWFRIGLLLLGLAGVAAVLCVLRKHFVFHRIRRKYADSPLDPHEAESCLRAVIRLLAEEKLYRRPDLTARMLAQRVPVSTRTLSQVLNEKLRQNFFEFVNQYRIEEARQRLCASSDKECSILEIAYAVGFNSKSAFNRAFKHFCGHPPSRLKKQLAADRPQERQSNAVRKRTTTKSGTSAAPR